MPGGNPSGAHAKHPLPKFCAIHIPYYMQNDLEPFAIVLLVEGLVEKVAEKQAWYYHEYIAALLFKERQP